MFGGGFQVSHTGLLRFASFKFVGPINVSMSCGRWKVIAARLSSKGVPLAQRPVPNAFGMETSREVWVGDGCRVLSFRFRV